MLQEILIKLYERDLAKLRDEITQYSDEADLWKTGNGISNPAGNLSLHLVGNLNHFIGAILGGTGYVRDRDAEFANKGVSREKLLADIEQAIPLIGKVIAGLSDEDLAAIYSIEVFGEPMTTGYFLTHLATHFNYHLGQINYHRRLVGSLS